MCNSLRLSLSFGIEERDFGILILEDSEVCTISSSKHTELHNACGKVQVSVGFFSGRCTRILFFFSLAICYKF